MVRDYVSKRYPKGYICSKCGIVASTFFDNRGMLLDGVYFCNECKPEIEFNWYRHHMNGSCFWREYDPPLYFTTLEELCVSDDASPEELKITRKLIRLNNFKMAVKVDYYREPKNNLQIPHIGWTLESMDETEVTEKDTTKNNLYMGGR